MIICTKCKVEQLESEFYSNAKQCKTCKRAYEKARRKDPSLQPKRNEYARRYVAKNKEKHNAYHRLYKKTSAKWKVAHRAQAKRRREKYPEYDKEWRIANPEKIKKYRKESYQRYKEDRIAYAKQWRKENPLYDRHYKALRKDYYNELKRKRLEKLTYKSDVKLKHIKELFMRAMQYGLCPLCEEVPKKWHLEHAIPLSHNEGSHTKKNIYFCCATCNLKKGTQTLEEYADIEFKDLPVTL